MAAFIAVCGIFPIFETLLILLKRETFFHSTLFMSFKSRLHFLFLSILPTFFFQPVMTKTLFNGCLFQLSVFADQPVAFLF